MMLEKPFVLSVKVVILDNSGRILVIKRSRASRGNPGKWDLPGGKAEIGEKFDQALLREVCEETGLSISLTCVAGSAESELPDKKVAYIIMEGRLKSGVLRRCFEHEDFAWIKTEEFPAMDLAEQFKPFAAAYRAAHNS